MRFAVLYGKNISGKKLWWIWEITSNLPKLFLPIFTAFNRIAYDFTLPMVKHMAFVYGNIFASSISIYQACSTIVTIECISITNHSLVSPVTFIMIQRFHDFPITTHKFKLCNKDNTVPSASNQWLLSACMQIIIYKSMLACGTSPIYCKQMPIGWFSVL